MCLMHGAFGYRDGEETRRTPWLRGDRWRSPWKEIGIAFQDEHSSVCHVMTHEYNVDSGRTKRGVSAGTAIEVVCEKVSCLLAAVQC